MTKNRLSNHAASHPRAPRLLLITSACLMASSCVQAQTTSPGRDDPYPYIGLSAGQVRSNLDTQFTVDQLLGSGVSTGVTDKLRDTGYKAFGGYQFTPYLGVEAAWFDLGHVRFDATTNGGTLGGRYKAKGGTLDLVLSLPFSDAWAVSARVGAQSAKTYANFVTSGDVSISPANRSKRDINIKFGAGLQYQLSRAFFVRAEAERFRINDAVGHHAGANLMSLGIVYAFGRDGVRAPMALAPAAYTAPVAQAEPAPAVAEAPPPVVVATAMPPAPAEPTKRRVSYTVESLFTFDESTIRPEGKVALDSFAKELAGSAYQVITVEGHTDRLGTVEYNQSLSERRAQKVKEYLVSIGGIPADKITAVGMSESQPVTTDCKGKAPTSALKACLQPDRRVDIEVTGTR